MLKQLSILSAAVILFASSCKSDSSMSATNCATSTDSLQREIASRDTRINGLLDSLKMMQGSSAATTTTVDTTAVTTAAAPDNAGGTGDKAGTGKSFYKTKKAHVVATSGGKYPGEFPEGSARVLTDKDLKFLSQWGLKVMLNEIYARHGMRFTDGEMQDHFRRQGWYKGTVDNVNSKLSPTEQQNVALIKAYKFTPQIGV